MARAQAGHAVATVIASYSFPNLPLGRYQNELLPGFKIKNERGLLLGSFGSDLWHGRDDPSDEFWMISDRGPNAEVAVGGKKRRTFPTPAFTPTIFHVRVANGSIDILEALPILGRSGAPVTGLPNRKGTDETPYDFAGQKRLRLNPSGLDTEALVRTANGEFWVGEEYSPSLVHIDAAGKVIERFVPKGVELPRADYPVAETLPKIFALRKKNRGFEGIALSPDEKTVYLVVESPLPNPPKCLLHSRTTRILAVDTATGQPSAEYAYKLDDVASFDPSPGMTVENMKVSGLAMASDSILLVDECTSSVARIYKVDLSKATNILGSAWDRRATSPSLEELNDPTVAGVTPLPKELLIDLSKLDGIPPKIEGIAILDKQTIAVSNDNDFDIGKFDKNGVNIGKGERTHILVIRTPPIV